MADSDSKSQKINLKYLDGTKNLKPKEVARILVTIRHWIYDFYNLSAGTRKINGDFSVYGFASREFDLSTSKDIINLTTDDKGKVIDFNKEPYIFMSDLANFVEQTYFPVSDKLSLTLEQHNELNKLPRLFTIFGVTPSGNTASNEGKITLQDLERFEEYHRSQYIITRIDEVLRILNLVEEAKKEEIELAKEIASSTSSNSGGGAGLPFGSGGSASSGDSDAEGGGPEEDSDSSQNQPDKDKRRPPEEPKRPDQKPDSNTPFKLSELDPQSKLYLQSLSIITINQALNRYFNDASLAAMGLAPGTRVTFDQLPLGIRQKLMDRAFSQVETLLLSGKPGFELQNLIENASGRISFSNEAALNLLIDVQGMNLINQAVKEIVKINADGATNKAATEKEIEKNQAEKLTNDKLDNRAKAKKENGEVLNNEISTKEAETFIEQKQKSGKTFADEIEGQLEIVRNEKQLDQTLLEKLSLITGYNDNNKNQMITNNIRSVVDLMIQQGLPPEYLIPSPERFDYNRFINIFGKVDISLNQFNEHKAEYAWLITFYWKRKRAIWVRDIRQEFSQERYSVEVAQQIYGEMTPAKAAVFRQLATTLNYTGGREAAKAMAGTAKVDVDAINKFVAQQQDLIAKNLEKQLSAMSDAEQQKTLKVYFEYYMPGAPIETYELTTFTTLILPQINPMDYYMLTAGQSSAPGAFAQNNQGFIQKAFLQPNGSEIGANGGGDDLIQNDFTRKALEWGIRAGVDAATGGTAEGFFQVLDAMDKNPVTKAIKDEILNKILDWIRKYWPWLLGAVAAAMAPLLLIPAALGWMISGGADKLKDMLFGTNKLLGHGDSALAPSLGQHANALASSRDALAQQTLAQQAQAAQAAQAVKAAQAAQASAATPALSHAMVVAGQAVVATVGGIATLAYFSHVSLNSAFLTDFPRNETELTGNTADNKTSKYAEMTKTATIKTGCARPENNGAKCVSPSFPLSIEYTVTISPKEDFSLQITNLEDTIKFKQSAKGWEKAGQTPPSIPAEKFLDLPYFESIIKEQGGLSDTPLSATPTPVPGSEDPNATSTPTPPQGSIVIPAGGSLSFSYTLDGLSAGYNNTAIMNTIEAQFYYQNANISGTDNLITAARVCLGECGGDAGCWPMTGTITQLPLDPLFSHAKPIGKSFMDAYDIGPGVGPALYGNPVYVPFDGNLCFQGCAASEGCYYVLTFDNGGETQKVNFLHFQDKNNDFGAANQCIQVEAGYKIGLSGKRGFTDGGNHLHYGAAHGEAFYMSNNPGFSIIYTLTPASNENNQPAKMNDHVTTCYE